VQSANVIPDSLRVLVIEDSVDDTFFIVRELQRGGFHVDFERVETAAAMQEALSGGNWDLIISDYSMPQFNGAAALSLYQHSQCDVPFIMVSGAMGEERVIEMLKSGAHDCVMKNNLGRLVPAVKRELEAARQRRTRTQKEAATAFLASIVRSCEDAIISNDLEEKIASWNSGAERLYGYTALEALGRPITMLFPAELKQEASRILAEIKRGGHIEGLETIRLRKDGAPVEVSLTISPIRDSKGAIIGASTVAREITRRPDQNRSVGKQPLRAA
jgi:two-component system cell cycle sensor histidine kinase/response regulator CckA